MLAQEVLWEQSKMSRAKEKRFQCSNFKLENAVFFPKNFKHMHVSSYFTVLTADNITIKTNLNWVHILEK